MIPELCESATSVGWVQGTVDHLARSIPGAVRWSHPRDVTKLLELLDEVRNARKALQDAEQFLEIAAAKRMPTKTLEWDGGTATRRKTAEKTTWDHSGLASAVAISALVDENGELPAEPVQLAAMRVKEQLFKFAGITYWRTTGLDAAGIDVSDFRTRTPGRWVVEVTTGTPQVVEDAA